MQKFKTGDVVTSPSIERIYGPGPYPITAVHTTGTCCCNTFKPREGEEHQCLEIEFRSATRIIPSVRVQLGPKIQLSRSNWWEELEELSQKEVLPPELASHLKSLLSSFFHNTIRPSASAQVIALAQEHLAGGICIEDAGGNYLYDIVVFTPQDENAESLRTFFMLIPKYFGGTFRYLG